VLKPPRELGALSHRQEHTRLGAIRPLYSECRSDRRPQKEAACNSSGAIDDILATLQSPEYAWDWRRGMRAVDSIDSCADARGGRTRRWHPSPSPASILYRSYNPRTVVVVTCEVSKVTACRVRVHLSGERRPELLAECTCTGWRCAIYQQLGAGRNLLHNVFSAQRMLSSTCVSVGWGSCVQMFQLIQVLHNWLIYMDDLDDSMENRRLQYKYIVSQDFLK
jgi:hypothetical protein